MPDEGGAVEVLQLRHALLSTEAGDVRGRTRPSVSAVVCVRAFPGLVASVCAHTYSQYYSAGRAGMVLRVQNRTGVFCLSKMAF